MVSAHCWLQPYSRKLTAQSGGQMVRYLKREGEFNPAHYLQRTDGKKKDYGDFVCEGAQNLPAWAQGDPGKFFAAARENESADRWYWGFQVEFSLPRELTHEQQMALREDFMAATMPNLPAMWVKHEKRLDNGEMHPHIHILLSARQVDGIDRDEVQTFKLWQRAHPERGGAPRDLFWSKDQAPEQLRQAMADLTNYHLELGKAQERLDTRSLKRQGSKRAAIRYGHEERPDAATLAKEQEQAVAAWEARKAYKEIGNVQNLSREEMVANVRAWTRELTPGKAIEQASPAMIQARMEVDVATLEERIARLEQYANDVDQARQGQHVPPSKLIALLAGSELEESTGKGLTMKLYQKERDESYGR